MKSRYFKLGYKAGEVLVTNDRLLACVSQGDFSEIHSVFQYRLKGCQCSIICVNLLQPASSLGECGKSNRQKIVRDRSSKCDERRNKYVVGHTSKPGGSDCCFERDPLHGIQRINKFFTYCLFTSSHTIIKGFLELVLDICSGLLEGMGYFGE